jgi:DNA mismatch endonuclease (patch repair protein)
MATPASWASSDATRHSMQGNRNRDTRPEMAVRSAVHAIGLRYRVDTKALPDLNRRADLVFTRAKVAVFVDGCFWHGCPDHFVPPRTNVEYWEAKIGRNRERDVETDGLLADAGWTVIRVWEHENPHRGAERVRAVLAQR